MRDREIIAVFHYEDHPLGSHRCGAEPYRYAEEIIRCKECKHRYDDGWLEPRWTCDYLRDMRLKDDDFCSYGERRCDE